MDATVARAEFDEVWAVLQALQEQDEVLDDIIHQMQAERRLTKGFSSDVKLLVSFRGIITRINKQVSFVVGQPRLRLNDPMPRFPERNCYDPPCELNPPAHHDCDWL